MTDASKDTPDITLEAAEVIVKDDNMSIRFGRIPTYHRKVIAWLCKEVRDARESAAAATVRSEDMNERLTKATSERQAFETKIMAVVDEFKSDGPSDNSNSTEFRDGFALCARQVQTETDIAQIKERIKGEQES